MAVPPQGPPPGPWYGDLPQVPAWDLPQVPRMGPPPGPRMEADPSGSPRPPTLKPSSPVTKSEPPARYPSWPPGAFASALRPRPARALEADALPRRQSALGPLAPRAGCVAWALWPLGQVAGLGFAAPGLATRLLWWLAVPQRLGLPSSGAPPGSRGSGTGHFDRRRDLSATPSDPDRRPVGYAVDTARGGRRGAGGGGRLQGGPMARLAGAAGTDAPASTAGTDGGGGRETSRGLSAWGGCD